MWAIEQEDPITSEILRGDSFLGITLRNDARLGAHHYASHDRFEGTQRPARPHHRPNSRGNGADRATCERVEGVVDHAHRECRAHEVLPITLDEIAEDPLSLEVL